LPPQIGARPSHDADSFPANKGNKLNNRRLMDFRIFIFSFPLTTPAALLEKDKAGQAQ
jgi:hypothetical protein